MEELKPCPFCGWDKARIISRYLDTKIGYVGDYRYTTEHKRFYVRCNRCYAHGGSISGYILKSFVKVSAGVFVNGHVVKNGYDRLADRFRWTAADLFEDPKEETEPPELPSFIRTKEQMEDKVAAMWNRREEWES